MLKADFDFGSVPFHKKCHVQYTLNAYKVHHYNHGLIDTVGSNGGWGLIGQWYMCMVIQ